MNDEKLKIMLREILEPVLDTLVEQSFSFFKEAYAQTDVPIDELEKQIRPAMEAVGNSICASVKTIKPEDVINKAKEMYTNGRRS